MPQGLGRQKQLGLLVYACYPSSYEMKPGEQELGVGLRHSVISSHPRYI